MTERVGECGHALRAGAPKGAKWCKECRRARRAAHSTGASAPCEVKWRPRRPMGDGGVKRAGPGAPTTLREGVRVVDPSEATFARRRVGIVFGPIDGRGRWPVVWTRDVRIFVGGTETLAIAPIEWWLPAELEVCGE